MALICKREAGKMKTENDSRWASSWSNTKKLKWSEGCERRENSICLHHVRILQKIHFIGECARYPKLVALLVYQINDQHATVGFYQFIKMIRCQLWLIERQLIIWAPPRFFRHTVNGCAMTSKAGWYLILIFCRHTIGTDPRIWTCA